MAPPRTTSRRKFGFGQCVRLKRSGTIWRAVVLDSPSTLTSVTHVLRTDGSYQLEDWVPTIDLRRTVRSASALAKVANFLANNPQKADADKLVALDEELSRPRHRRRSRRMSG